MADYMYAEDAVRQTARPSPDRDGRLTGHISSMDEALATLDRQIDRLLERLRPIVDPPDDPPATLAEVETEPLELVRTVRNQAHRVRAASERLADLTNGIAL